MKNIFSKKGLFLLTAAAFLVGGFFVANTAHAANTWAVNNTLYSNNTGCVSPTFQCNTIQAAVTPANDGDTINVAAGTYKESNIAVNKSVNIIGAGESSTLIAPAILYGAHAQASAGFNDAFRLTANNVSIKNLTIDGNLNGGALDFHNGIIQGPNTTNNLTVQNVTIKNVWWRGINMRGATGGGTGHLIDHVTVSGVSGVLASDPAREQNIGVVFFGPSNAEVKNSTFSNAGTGLATGGYPINTINWHDNTVSNVDEMAYEPLVVGDGSFFTNNTATFTTEGNHAVGIEAGYSTKLNITNSTVTGAKFGARVEVQTTPNAVTDLVFGAGTVFNGPGISTVGSVGILGKDKDTNGGAVTNFTVDGAKVTGYETGVTAILTSGGPSIVNVKNSSIAGNGTGVAATANTSFSATPNWWGTAIGTEIAAKISGNVTYEPYYIDSGMTTTNTQLANAKTTAHGVLTTALATYTESNYLPANWTTLNGLKTSGDNGINAAATLAHIDNAKILTINKMAGVEMKPIVTFTPSVTGDFATITIPVPVTKTVTVSDVVVTLDIPSNTEITGPAGWTGTVNFPTISTTTVEPIVSTGNIATVAQSIEVGFSNVHLTLDRAVKLTFADQAGKLIGWSQAGVFHQITNQCDSNADTTTINNGQVFPADSECAKSVGNDLVVWTKHFTTFTTYTQTPRRSSGGGGGMINLSPTPTVSTTPVVVGQVLGAEKFIFTKLIKKGSKGNEVMELQKLLNSAGYNVGKIDGIFGAKVRAAVIKFQLAKKLKGDGIVGPKLRDFLNK